MSLELHALLDEAALESSQPDQPPLTSHIENINSLPNQNSNESIPLDSSSDLHRDTDDFLDTLSMTHTATSPSLRRTAQQQRLLLKQQQRKNTHHELLRYPGWNYYLNLSSEAVLLLITVFVTGMRFSMPFLRDIIALFRFLFTPSLPSSPSSPSSPINDPYIETNPLPIINDFVLFSSLHDLRSVTPIMVFFLTLFIYTQIPQLKRYIRLHQTLNISTSMPFPPPAIYLTHALLLLTMTLSIDFFAVGYFEYKLLYSLYQNTPSNQTHTLTPTHPLISFTPVVFQGFMIIVYLILVLGQLCLTLLMLTECYCLLQSQKWWINYTTSFQTKKRCFIVGNYTQIRGVQVPGGVNRSSPNVINDESFEHFVKILLSSKFWKDTVSVIISYSRIYYVYFKLHTIYFIQKRLLCRNDVTPPAVFPYHIGDRHKFKQLILKKFPFLSSQQQLTPVNSPQQSAQTHTHTHGPNNSPIENTHLSNIPNHTRNDDSEDEFGTLSPKKKELDSPKEEKSPPHRGSVNSDETSSLLGSSDSTNVALVIPCVVLPPYIYPIQTPILRLLWDSFALQLVEWIKQYRENVQNVGTGARNTSIDADNTNNGPSLW